jgi:hypothetical protein
MSAGRQSNITSTRGNETARRTNLYVLSRIMLPGYVRQSLYQLSGRLALGNTCTYTRPTVRRAATRVPSCHRYGSCEGDNVNQRLKILVDGESNTGGWQDGMRAGPRDRPRVRQPGCRRCCRRYGWRGQSWPPPGAMLRGAPAYLFRTSIPRFRMTSSPALCSGSFASG